MGQPFALGPFDFSDKAQFVCGQSVFVYFAIREQLYVPTRYLLQFSLVAIRLAQFFAQRCLVDRHSTLHHQWRYQSHAVYASGQSARRATDEHGERRMSALSAGSRGPSTFVTLGY
jgi:hypothetical protein